MDNQILAGKKLLISLENHSLLRSNEIFPILQNTFSPARVITTYGKKDTMYAALHEKPDVIFFHWDSDPSFGPIIDMQWQIHKMNHLDCKLMLYSKHDDSRYEFGVRSLLEAINRIAFVETGLPHEEVVNRVHRCLQAKGVKVLIAAEYTLDFNWMRFCVNTFYPGNHIIYPPDVDEIHDTNLDESDFMIVGFREAKNTSKLLDRLKTKDIKANVLVVSQHEHFKDECITSRMATHYLFGTIGTSGSDIVRFLDPYLGNFQ